MIKPEQILPPRQRCPALHVLHQDLSLVIEISGVFYWMQTSWRSLCFGGYSKTESFERATQGARLENPLESTSLFERSDSTFSSDLPSSLTSISTLPRSRPLLSTVKDVIRKEAESYDVKGSALFEKNFGPALEVAYRMAVLPDEAVEKYLTDHWIMGAADFPYRDKNNENNLSVAQISKVMKDRKEAFIEHFGFESIKRWEENNPLQAVKVS